MANSLRTEVAKLRQKRRISGQALTGPEVPQGEGLQEKDEEYLWLTIVRAMAT
jgi:hypothetical protein